MRPTSPGSVSKVSSIGFEVTSDNHIIAEETKHRLSYAASPDSAASTSSRKSAFRFKMPMARSGHRSGRQPRPLSPSEAYNPIKQRSRSAGEGSSLGSNDAVTDLSISVSAWEQSSNYSIGGLTAASTETTKANNTGKSKVAKQTGGDVADVPPPPPPPPAGVSNESKTPRQRHRKWEWDALKRFMGTKKTANEGKDTDGLMTAERPRPRARSTPDAGADVRPGDGAESVVSPGRSRGDDDLPTYGRSEGVPYHHLDEAIRGRLDGLDIMSLGPANLTVVKEQKSFAQVMSPLLTTELIVKDMMWTSSGKVPPELVLEGFFPGGADRWTVRLEHVERPKYHLDGVVLHGKRKPPSPSMPLLQRMDLDECESNFSCDSEMPLSELLEAIWGTDQSVPPTHLSPRGRDGDQLTALQKAAANAVPIDIDDNTFIIETCEHLRAVHEIAAAMLKLGRFEGALEIFEKIAQGLLSNPDENKPFLLGQTYHNIGLVQMWQSNFHSAAESFEKALENRKRCLPKGHVDIGVSFVRYGISLFACRELDRATSAMHDALQFFQTDNMSKAIVLNNLGVVQYERQNMVEAIRSFTSALEIQRSWLENKVRRETLVYDVATTLGNMGKCYLDQRDYETAFFVFEEALLLQTTVFRKDHECVLNSLANLAHAKSKGGDAKRALRIYSGLLRSQEAKHGLESYEATVTTGIIGQLQARLCDFTEAIRSLESVEQWQSTYMHDDHPARKVIEDLIQQYRGKLEEDEEISVWI